jgi:hypothetical protein
MKITAKHIILITLSLLMSGCVSTREIEQGIGEMCKYKVEEVIQDRILVVIASSYYIKQGKWPASIDQMKEYYDKEMKNKDNSDKKEIEPNWDMVSPAKLNIMQDGNLKIEYEAKLDKILGGEFKINPTESKFTIKINNSEVVSEISTENYIKRIVIEPPKKLNNGS